MNTNWPYETKLETCLHCWHPCTKPMMIILHSGEIVQECCKCHTTQVVHAAHAREGRW